MSRPMAAAMGLRESGRLRASTALGGMLAFALISAAGPAAARDECGAPADGSVTCTPGGNPYGTGITYDTTESLKVVVEKGVEVRDSVFVNSSGTVQLTNDGTVGTTRDFASGVIVEGAGTATLDGSGNITTTGTNAYGIVIGSGGGFSPTDGNLGARYDGDVTTNGFLADGVLADKGRGDGDIDLTLGGDVTTQGEGANGIYARADGGSIAIVSTGTVSTQGNSGFSFPSPRSGGIVALAGGNISIDAANIVTAGDRSVGIVAIGGEDVTVRAGTIRASGNAASGIVARSTSSGGEIDDPQNPQALAASLPGVFPPGLPFAVHNVTVTAADVAVTGAEANAIDASAGGAVVVNAGRASATNGAAIRAISRLGAVDVTLTGTATSGTGPAIIIAAGTTASLNIGADASLTSATGGATLASLQGSSVTNAGAITGDGTASVIAATGGRLTFDNAGQFTGRIGFTDGDDMVANTGIYRALYDQDFGGGSDTFDNSGIFLVRPGTTSAGTVNLTGLEAFDNSGLVDLRNGHAGDVLATSGSFTGTGDSTLAIDVASGAGATSDRLIAAGAITGSTALVIHQIGGATLNAGTAFATGGAGSSATAFTTAGRDIGLVRYGVVFNAADNSYAVVATPGDAVFRALKINEGAQQVWHKSADTWSAHMSDLRDAKFAGADADGGRLWGQFYGSTVSRRDDRSFSAFGSGRNVDLSYRQDAYGGQLGLDLGSRDTGSGNLVLGVTGGYLNSDLTFRNSADRTNFSVVNGGAYASYVSGNLFANILGKYDRIWADAHSPFAGFSDKFHGQSYGGQGEIGIRLGGEAFYAEPVGSIAYLRTDLNDIHALDQTIDFDRLDGLRGKAGLRVGGKFDLGGTIAVIYAQGNYVREFKGKDGITFVSADQALSYRNDRIRDYGEGKLGFNVATPGGVTGFVEGFGNYARSYKGGGGRAGLRVKL